MERVSYLQPATPELLPVDPQRREVSIGFGINTFATTEPD